MPDDDGLENPDPTPETNPELAAWRLAHGRAHRIGDLPPGSPLPPACRDAFRALYPGRDGMTQADPAASLPFPQHRGGRMQAGYFVPHKVT